MGREHADRLRRDRWLAPAWRHRPVAPDGTTAATTSLTTAPSVLTTTAGEFPLEEFRVTFGERAWKILHTGLVLTADDEQRYISGDARLPYGVALWPSSLALTHELEARGAALRGRRILELGAGTGLPGIVASALGAHVVQTDRQSAALHLCRLNGERNGAGGVEQRLDDWCDWHDTEQYDWIIGSDILYAQAMHPHLRSIFESNLVPGGMILMSDPFRPSSLELLEQLDGDGWSVSFSKWSVGAAETRRPIAVYALRRDG